MRTLYRAAIVVMAIMLAVVGVLALQVFYVQPTTYRADHLSVVKTLSDPSKKVIIRSWFLKSFNFTELLGWVHENLEYVPFNASFPEEYRSDDPLEIMESGRGRSREFCVLYVAACLAHGYRCRLVTATEFSLLSWADLHEWAEVRLGDRWVHVDPLERRLDEREMYRQWSWGNEIGLKVRIFAFEEDLAEDVTLSYA